MTLAGGSFVGFLLGLIPSLQVLLAGHLVQVIPNGGIFPNSIVFEVTTTKCY